MDRLCSICGLDYTSVKLTTMKAMTGAKLNQDTGYDITVCEHCKAELLRQNHPINHNLGETPVDQGGFIKPSTPESDKPAVRPQ